MIKEYLNKYKLIIFKIICAVLAFFAAINKNEDIFLLDSKNLINILLTLLGLCLTSLGFIESSINNMLSKISDNTKRKNKNRNTKILIQEIRSDIVYIFKAIIILMIINTFLNIDIPFVSDFYNLNLKVFTIYSAKHFFFNFIIALCFNIAVGCLYDLMEAMFMLLQTHYDS